MEMEKVIKRKSFKRFVWIFMAEIRVYGFLMGDFGL